MIWHYFLIYCCEKVFTFINRSMIRQNSTKISLPEKEDFYYHLNVEGTTDENDTHGKKVCKDFEINKLE